MGLNDPAEIQRIPDLLKQYVPSAEVREKCWSPAAPGRLRELVAASRKPRAVVAS